MKSKISIVVLMVIVISLCALTTWAQEEKSEPQLWLFAHYKIKPSMVNKLEADLKEMVGYCKKHNYEYPWYTLKTDDYHIYYVMPIKDKNDIDRLFMTWGEVAKKVGAPWQEMMKDYWDSYDYYKRFLLRHRPDISYNPEKAEGEQEEANFFVWHIDYVKPGKEADYEAIHKEWVDMNKRINSVNAYNVYAVELGFEGSVYIGMSRGKNISQWYADNAKWAEKAGKEGGMERFERGRKLIRKHETKHLWYRPDLSYEIEKK
jgi:hypothetical protein